MLSNREFSLIDAILTCFSEASAVPSGATMLRKIIVFLCFVQVCSGQRSANDPLLNPKSPAMNQTAPETYRVLFSTSKGDFTLQVTRAWAPKGADRFYNLVKNGFYDGLRFFRVIRTPRPFMAQFGISGD